MVVCALERKPSEGGEVGGWGVTVGNGEGRSDERGGYGGMGRERARPEAGVCKAAGGAGKEPPGGPEQREERQSEGLAGPQH